MAMRENFHKNVYLLTQLEEPSFDFKKYFRLGMFDKANTSGFIYISQYLLVIYDPKRFEKYVQWPVVCKKTEATYRNNVKEFLSIIAYENPDIGFPGILLSHLMHATGSKFLKIMYKLSQVVLRTYLRREGAYDVMNLPQPGVGQEMAVTVIKNITESVKTEIVETHNDHLNLMKEVEECERENQEERTQVKAALFKKKKTLDDVAEHAVVAPVIRKRLFDVEDYLTVEEWKKFIRENFELLSDKIKNIRSFVDFSTEIVNALMNIITGFELLDGSVLKIDPALFMDPSLPPEIQVLSQQLTTEEDKLILTNFITFSVQLLYFLFKLTERKGIPNMLEIEGQLEASCTDMKSMYEALNIMQERLSQMLIKTKKDLDLFFKQMPIPRNTVVSDDIHKMALMSSPQIVINTDMCYEGGSNKPPELNLTPVQGAHKELFYRHKRIDENNSISSKLRQPTILPRPNLNETISSISSGITHRRRVFNGKKVSTALHSNSKYSRLLSSQLLKSNAANSTLLSLPGPTNANSTIMSAIDKSNSMISPISKSSFSFSLEKKTPKKSPMKVKTEEFLMISKEEYDLKFVNSKQLDSITNPSTTELDLLRLEPEPETNNVRSIEKKRRMSIGDLVERYKKLLDQKGKKEETNTISEEQKL